MGACKKKLKYASGIPLLSTEYKGKLLMATAPALALVTNASIRSFYRLALRTIGAYSAGVQYGTKEFKNIDRTGK